MTAPTRSLTFHGTDAVTWPLDRNDGLAGEQAATTLLSAGAAGILGHASSEDWERIQSILRSMSGFARDAGIENDLTGTPSHPWSQTQHFVRGPGRSAADAICRAIDVLWSYVDDAVFLFRCGDTLGAESRLGRALQVLQESFSPTHVQRVKNADGGWVITDVFERAGPSERGKGDHEDKTAEAQQSCPPDLTKARVLASEFLLSYFVQRVLGLASEAGQTRQNLERAYLHEETS